MIPTPVGASPSAVTKLPSSLAASKQAECTNAQKNPPLALTSVGNAEFAQLSKRNPHGGSEALHSERFESAPINTLSSKMREKIWSGLDAEGFSTMIGVYPDLAHEVIATFHRLPEESKSTLWTRACDQNQIKGVKFLIANGVDVDMPGANGERTLRNAAMRGHIELAKLLVGIGWDGAHVSTTDGRSGGSLHLFCAVADGEIDVVRNLLLAGANANTMNSRGESTLAVAYTGRSKGDEKLVRMLTEAGADPNQQMPVAFNTLPLATRELIWSRLDAEGFPAAIQAYPDLVQEVIAAFHRLPAERKSTLWARACDQNQIEGVKFLIANGVDVDMPGANGERTLRNAAMRGHIELAKLLVGIGWDGAHVSTSDGRPGGSLHLFCAAADGEIDVVRNLLLAGANANTMNSRGESTLAVAYTGRTKGDEKLVRMLTEAGADPNQRI